jgi:hypothetical protein
MSDSGFSSQEPKFNPREAHEIRDGKGEKVSPKSEISGRPFVPPKY